MSGLVVGNWKMHGDITRIGSLLTALLERAPRWGETQVAVCPPGPYLFPAAQQLAGSSIKLGAQDCAACAEGAQTGEVAASMLVDVGCKCVIVGHSERRAAGESDTAVAQKVAQALNAGLTVIACVGESLSQRDAGQAEQTVRSQLEPVLAAVAPVQVDKLHIAYEPIWAIGSGRSATAEQAQAVHQSMRSTLEQKYGPAAAQVLLLYGGSVKAGNAAALFAQPDINGALVGGASLDADEFSNIIEAAA